VEETARESMSELRQLLDVLRERPTRQALEAPVHGLDDLPGLCRQVGAAGVRVSLTSTGQPRTLSAGLALTVYRVVQEALTNVVKHAEVGSAEVRLTWTAEQLEVVVVDRGAGLGTGTGHGLVGMRERVAAYGGELEAGPRTYGGYLVGARFPLVPPT
jgi:signal transduction histidine kinase